MLRTRCRRPNERRCNNITGFSLAFTAIRTDLRIFLLTQRSIRHAKAHSHQIGTAGNDECHGILMEYPEMEMRSMSGASSGQTWSHTFRQIFAGTLGPPLNKDRSFARRIDYAYRSIGDGKFTQLADPSHGSCDLAVATTLTGATVNRNRAIVQARHRERSGGPSCSTVGPGRCRKKKE